MSAMKKMQMHASKPFGVLVAVFMIAMAAGARRDARPNIIVILTDDQGYGDVGRHGNPILKTPNFDRLHDESVRFTDFQVSPCCAPTRCALLTGMHEFKSGVTHTIKPWREMNPRSTTVAQTLKTAGYATGIFGKWHLGLDDAYRPNNRGFDEALHAKGDVQKSHFDPVLSRDGVEKKYKGYREDILFAEAMAFIEKNKDGKFFCYIPTYAPHTPNIAPEEYVEPYKDHPQAAFFGQVANVDQNIGLLLAKLVELKIDQETLIVLISDNGGTKGVDAWNAGMRGCKATPWIGGTRAMSFWRWPGVFKPRDVGSLTAHIDVLPTLAEISKAPLTEKHRSQLDGLSLLPLLNNPAAPWPADRMLFTNVGRWGKVAADTHAHNFAAVRMGKYHLVNNRCCADAKCRHAKCKQARGVADGSYKSIYTEDADKHYALTPEQGWGLYDLEHDVSESSNLAGQHPEVVERMAKAYDAWWAEVRPLMFPEDDV
ncbi:Arylsulfatase [Pontiella desulfatans]|uniref:Arylsulfatase n=1 Tax=Pontiella desulfatans TaxID=2750659 RepID=A0A6C2TXP1_PONDE|nr:arylsulfatase [Pontiella desulfatans]SPS73655.1 sulfatase S1_17 [Kiritimatiellales bacterium]VGO12349.1 Arylsulfatase [Pontiella desulfatans]